MAMLMVERTEWEMGWGQETMRCSMFAEDEDEDELDGIVLFLCVVNEARCE